MAAVGFDAVTHYVFLPDWKGEPTLWLDPTLDGTRAGLETALHEALHLACPFMYEDVVTQTARYQAQRQEVREIWNTVLSPQPHAGESS